MIANSSTADYVLNCLMIEPSLLDETRLTPEVFIDREIALLFQMVRDMREAGIEINATTLVFEAKRVKLGAGSLYDQLGVARSGEAARRKSRGGSPPSPRVPSITHRVNF